MYFLNPANGEDEYEDPETHAKTDLNYYDSNSVKYEATNIGTEDLNLSVRATLSGGENFTYFNQVPVVTAADVLREFYYKVGPIWEADARVISYHPKKEYRNVLIFIKDYYWEPSPPSYSSDWDDVLGGNQGSYEWGVAATILTKDGNTTKQEGELLGEYAKNDNIRSVDDLYKALEEWKVVRIQIKDNNWNYVNVSDYYGKAGMFMGLNIATGDEEHKEYDRPTETPLNAKSSDPKDAEAVISRTVKGVPDNYKIIWDSEAKTYRNVINPQRSKPFQTVAFWFRGVATNIRSVPEDMKIPKLDFTWSFSVKKDT